MVGWKLEVLMINTLEVALERIKELEAENRKLLSELEYYRNRNYGGRKKHNEKWMVAYNDFVAKYEDGMAIMEIVAEGKISRRTAYRYKAYYDELKKMQGE
jgi:hypoxanthine phosphoribosyltransferase